MDRSEAEQQAKCWAFWFDVPPHRLRVDGPDDRAVWRYWYASRATGKGHWVDGPDLSGLSSPDLRRAIEAKAEYISLIYVQPPNDAAKAETWDVLIEANGKNFTSVGPSLEAALYAAALAAADTGA